MIYHKGIYELFSKHLPVGWEEPAKSDLETIVNGFTRRKIQDRDDFITDMVTIRKGLELKKERLYKHAPKRPSDIDQEIKRFRTSLQKSKQILCEIFPDIEELKQYSPLEIKKITRNEISLLRSNTHPEPKPYDWIGELVDTAIDAAMSKQMKDMAMAYRRFKNPFDQESGALSAAAGRCLKSEIVLSPSDNSQFYKIVQWLLPDVKDPKERIKDVAKKYEAMELHSRKRRR